MTGAGVSTEVRGTGIQAGSSDRVRPCLKHIYPQKEKKWTTKFIDICQSLKEPKGSNTHRHIQKHGMPTRPVIPHHPSQCMITGGNGTFKKQSPVGGHSSHGTLA